MAISRVDIASQALTLIRANAISNFNEGTNEADIVSVYYETFIRDIFSRYPWKFATKKRRLNLSTSTPVNEWKYEFIIPDELLYVKAIYDTDGLYCKPITDYDVQDNKIYANSDKLWAEYTYYVPENKWPGYFTQYAIYALAAMLAIPVTDDSDLAAQMQQLAYGNPSEAERGGKFRTAISTESQQAPNDEIYTSELIAARFF